MHLISSDSQFTPGYPCKSNRNRFDFEFYLIWNADKYLFKAETIFPCIAQYIQTFFFLLLPRNNSQNTRIYKYSLGGRTRINTPSQTPNT